MQYHLAQINIAQFLKPIHDPANADFVAALDHVNATAEKADGFVWRLIEDIEQNSSAQYFGDPNIIVNMSVWKNLEALTHFTYRTPAHVEIMKRRKEWFENIQFSLVLWWIELGQTPTVQQGQAKLELLKANGPSDQAFTFAQPFANPN